jgi:UDP-glucose 4-epimerase
MAHVWITGAHGFIGRYLARWLADQNHTVAGIGHGAWPQAEAGRWGVSTWMNGEISASNLGQIRQGAGTPDLVFHLAGGSSVGTAFASPQEDFTRTVVSTAELLEWLRQQAPVARMVAVSSAAVYGAGHEGPIPEDARLNPYSPYGTHKLMMEVLCRSYAANFGTQVVLPRLFSVYGPELKKQLLWDLCSKFTTGGEVELGGTGNELRDWTDVQDVVRALDQTSMLASEQAPVLNLATGVATPVREIVFTAALHWGEDAVTRLCFSGRSRPGDPFSLVANIDRMNAHGIKCPTSVTHGVAEYVNWFRNKVKDQD